MKAINEDDEIVIKPYTDDKLNHLGMMFKKIGIEALVKNEVCLIILAGGQGTRLGFDGPKGLYRLEGIGTLFELFKEKIQSIQDQYGFKPKVFIMTSEFTHIETERYFRNSDVVLFKQDSEFCLDDSNNFIPFYSSYARSPNGNGGLYKAIRKIDLKPYKIVNVVSIDNVLSKIFDPISVGCFVYHNFDILSKSVTRLDGENAGFFVFTNRIEVLEYSEFKCTAEKAQANILNHLFSTSFLEKVQREKFEYHYVKKKIKYTEKGNLITPKEPNGYKKEIFIFDAFVFTDNSGLMNVPRALEFSPLKNGLESSTDNPTTCIRDYVKALSFGVIKNVKVKHPEDLNKELV